MHYFKKEQPALNWLDPSFAAQRAVSGDIVKTMHSLGARAMRLDAVPFLGIEPRPDDRLTLHFKHPLSVHGTNSLAFLIRKLGGFSFHELNVPLRDLKAYTEHGPDLSYDFFTRAQCLHALLMEDATMLRQSFQFLLDAEVQPIGLVHDLQNHDEITYQLVELDARGDENFKINGKEFTGRQLREQMLREMRHKADPYKASRAEREKIQQAHLLLAAANAMQPGVFSPSSWDLVGALPIPEESIAERMKDGDYRWINRGGVDLMGANPDKAASQFGVERAAALYGSLPEQLQNPNSFARKLARLLKARKKYHIAEGDLLAVPRVANSAVCLLVIRPPGPRCLIVTALNFAQEQVREDVDLGAVEGLEEKELTGKVLDILDGEELSTADSGRITLELPPLSARTIRIGPARNER